MGIRDELSDTFGRIDRTKLTHIRTLFDETEPLVARTEYDDPLDPRVLRVHLTAGFDARGRFDIRWSEDGYYSIHYTEENLNCRFDRHPNTHSPLKHFHPPRNVPPEAALRSCIEVERAELVALAAIQQWRAALEGSDPAMMNEGDNPP